MGKGVALVTGATGFIGRWAAKSLLIRGFEVHALGSSTSNDPVEELRGATLHNADLLSEVETTKIIRAVCPSHLLHFAWNATPGTYSTSPDNYSWAAASLLLLRAFREAGGKRFVGAGSCAEYDWSRAGVCDEYATPTVLAAPQPASPYATCKASLGRIVAAYGEEANFSTAWGRVFFQYGPYEHPKRFVSSVIRSLLAGEEAACSHGRQRRSFLTAMDVGDAFAALATSDVQGPVNIADARTIGVGELAIKIGQLMSREDLVALGRRPAPSGEPEVLLARLDRLEKEVGWKPTETLESGLEKTIGWWRAQTTIPPRQSSG